MRDAKTDQAWLAAAGLMLLAAGGCSAAEGSDGAAGGGGTGGGYVPGGGTGGQVAGTGGVAAGTGGTPVQPSPVAPVQSGTRYVFTVGPASMEIDPQVGGRITALSLTGVNLLTGPEVDSINWGSTLWTAPQDDWTWPPVPEIDNAPYTATVSDTLLTLVGPVAPDLGVSVTKEFSADAGTGWFTITYGLTNQSTANRSMAPWEVSRVRPGGLSFFPTGAGSTGDLPVTDIGGTTWFDYTVPTVPRGGHSAVGDGARGWLAHVESNVLIVKSWTDIPVASQTPGEGEVKLYTAPGDDNQMAPYVELEVQGPYASIAPGSTVTWTIRWLITFLPDNVSAVAGSPDLVALVDSLVQ